MSFLSAADLLTKLSTKLTQVTEHEKPATAKKNQQEPTNKQTQSQQLHKIVQNIPAPNGKKENEFDSKAAALLFWNQLKNVPKNTNIARIWYESNNCNPMTLRIWTIVEAYGRPKDKHIIKKYLHEKYSTEFFQLKKEKTKNNDDALKIHQISEPNKHNIALTHFSAQEKLIFPHRENGKTFEGMNKIIAKYYQYMQDNTYYKQDARGKFLAFCQDNNLKENNFWCQLFEVLIEKCIYLKFDKQFPLFYRKKKKPTRRYSSDIEGIDKAFADYYISLDCGEQYFDENGDGLFEVYCEENDLDFDTLIDEIETDDADECSLIEMDYEFPLEQLNNNKYEYDVDMDREQRIFEVVKYIFVWGCSPTDYYVNLAHNQYKLRDFLQYCYENGQPLKPLMTILDYDLDIDNAETLQIAKDIIEKQTNCVFYENIKNDVHYRKIFSIGYNHRNYNFLLYLMDSYEREKLYEYGQHSKEFKFDIKAWIDNNWVLNNILKDTNITTDYLRSALSGNIRHFRKTLILNPHIKIYDDIETISRYIISFTEFIKLYLLQYKHIIVPFQIDAMIAINKCKQYAINIEPYMFGRGTGLDELEEVEQKQFDVGDCIGDVIDKLTNEKCLYVNREIKDIENINNILAECFDEFKDNLFKTYNCDGMYPSHRRFCIFIDRRSIRDAHKNELIIFSPPNNCNIIQKDHIPQAMSVMSSECLIPQRGYNLGENKSPRQMIQANKEKITINSHCKGQLMTFSFHIEQMNEIRCYMHWFGQSIRFYPQDIVQVLPIIFDSKYSTKNRDFKESELAKRMTNGALLKDIYFEHFYNHLTRKENNIFPTHKYDEWTWPKNTQNLVFGYLRLCKEYSQFIDDINNIVLRYFCYY